MVLMVIYWLILVEFHGSQPMIELEVMVVFSTLREFSNTFGDLEIVGET